MHKLWWSWKYISMNVCIMHSIIYYICTGQYCNAFNIWIACNLQTYMLYKNEILWMSLNEQLNRCEHRCYSIVLKDTVCIYVYHLIFSPCFGQRNLLRNFHSASTMQKKTPHEAVIILTKNPGKQFLCTKPTACRRCCLVTVISSSWMRAESKRRGKLCWCSVQLHCIPHCTFMTFPMWKCLDLQCCSDVIRAVKWVWLW